MSGSLMIPFFSNMNNMKLNNVIKINIICYIYGFYVNTYFTEYVYFFLNKYYYLFRMLFIKIGMTNICFVSYHY